MKKKLLSVLLMTCMVLGLTACGGVGEKAPIVTIEGNKYNLSEDFQEVVGSMVADDLVVSNMGILMYVYDEDGKLLEVVEKDEDATPNIVAMENRVGADEAFDELEEELGDFVRKFYFISGREVDFESGLKISEDSKKKDVKEIKGLTKLSPSKYNSDSYGAIFVDDELIKIEDFEDAFEEWKEICDEEGFMAACEEVIPNMHYAAFESKMLMADYLKFNKDYESTKLAAESAGVELKEDIMLALAMQDACMKLEEGDAESVSIIRFNLNDDNVYMEYTEYYFVEDWDSSKFSK